MNWVIILLILFVVILFLAFVGAYIYCDYIILSICIVGIIVSIGLFAPLLIVTDNIRDKYDWYIETRLKYAEAEGIEKEYIEMNDVMTYNLWYELNKEDLENPWNLKSAAGREFDYIKIKGD